MVIDLAWEISSSCDQDPAFARTDEIKRKKSEENQILEAI
jgi:hypothetical protein